MKKKRTIHAISTILLTSLTLETVVAGRLLVKEKPGRPLTEALKPFGGEEEGGIPQLGVSFVKVPDFALERALEGLKHNPNIEFAEEDGLLQPEGTVNDSYFGSEWHLSKIEATTAWDDSTGAGVTVAVLDTGVDGTHPDLSSKLVPGWNVYSGNSDTSDVHGHGTGVAGAVAAASDNSVGVASVAYNAKLMPIRISDSTGYATWSATAQGIIWAADHGARVANLSFSGMSGSSTINSAAQYLQSKGGIVVTAAGNDGRQDSSSENPYLINVSATDENDLLTTFSNWGSSVDLSAPGVDVWSTVRGGGYGSWWGTSLAAPMVSGTAALVISANPALTASQVESILKSSADDLGAAGRDSVYGAGRVNAAEAVALALNTSGSSTGGTDPQPTPEVTDTTPPTIRITSPTDGARIRKTVTISVAVSDNVGVTRVELYVDGRAVSSSTTSPFSTKWNSSKSSSGAHTVQAKAFDAAGNWAVSQSIDLYK